MGIIDYPYADDSYLQLQYLVDLMIPRPNLIRTVPLSELKEYVHSYERSKHEKFRKYIEETFGRTVSFFSRDLEFLDNLSRKTTVGFYRRTPQGMQLVTDRISAILRDGVEYFSTSNDIKEVLPPFLDLLKPIAITDTIAEITVSTSETVGKNLGLDVKIC